VLSSDEKVNEILDKINMTAAQMDLLLRKLIQIHQIMNGANYVQVDFKAMVLQLESDFQDRLKTSQAIIQLDFKSEEPLITDPEIMKIILTYLLDNSLQYAMPINSRKLIVTIGYEVVEGKVMITFHDNGLGISPEIKEKVFNMFFIGNTNSKGNGLGLYVVKKGVERMDGEITFESIPDRYTCFVVKLPKHEVVPAALVESSN
jgi:signal transduction histidine kinase